jgi:hypothetical protein
MDSDNEKKPIKKTGYYSGVSCVQFTVSNDPSNMSTDEYIIIVSAHHVHITSIIWTELAKEHRYNRDEKNYGNEEYLVNDIVSDFMGECLNSYELTFKTIIELVLEKPYNAHLSHWCPGELGNEHFGGVIQLPYSESELEQSYVILDWMTSETIEGINKENEAERERRKNFNYREEVKTLLSLCRTKR